MTKEEVLQKVNDYCTEKQYTTATLTDAFKDKFATHFQAANAEGDINDEVVLGNLRFALNTAFSSASELATVKTNEFVAKENDYKSQIATLQQQRQTPPPPPPAELPDDVKQQLQELQKFKESEQRQKRFKNIVSLAKASVRQDLHASFDKFASDYSVQDDKEDKEQATALVAKFQDIFRDSIGDIKPRTPIQQHEEDTAVLKDTPVIKVQ